MRIEPHFTAHKPNSNNAQVRKNRGTPASTSGSMSGTGGLDTVSFSSKQHFQDVLNEMRRNVPDRTTTVEEKELAISYINRMLACSDIEPDVKTYWENKKVIIQNEIQNIKNEQAMGANTDFSELEAEFWNYSNNVWHRPAEFESVPDRVEYWLSYYNTCISYIDRLLNCDGITEEKRAEYQNMRNNMIFDANNHKHDLNRYNLENSRRTESFNDVLSEMRRNVPDMTTTVSEKQLAISYIDRMLSCDDISLRERAFWEHQRAVIEQEIENFNE